MTEISLIVTLNNQFTLPYLTERCFYRTFATGEACQQRTLTPPDTWSCPTVGLASVLKLRPISPELVLLPDFWVSNIPRYFWFFCALNRYPCTTASGQVVPEGACRLVIMYECQRTWIIQMYSGLDVAHYKKVPNRHVSGNGHVSYCRCPTYRPRGYYQTELRCQRWQHLMVSECGQIHPN